MTAEYFVCATTILRDMDTHDFGSFDFERYVSKVEFATPEAKVHRLRQLSKRPKPQRKLWEMCGGPLHATEAAALAAVKILHAALR